MTSNVDNKDLELPFDLYVHAALKDYTEEIEMHELRNIATNNYITCSTYETVAQSKKKRKESTLQPYIKISGETKQFLAGFISDILEDAKKLCEVGIEFASAVEDVRLTDIEEKYIKGITRGDREFMEERNFRLNILRMQKFSKLCSEQLDDSICSFVYKMISSIEITRKSTLAQAKMNLEDADKSEDTEAKLIGKLKTAMDNSPYKSNDIFRMVVIYTIVHFMKCIAFVVNRYIWHKHGPQNPGNQVIAGLLASHGLNVQFIKKYSEIKPKAAKKTKKVVEEKK